MADENEKPQRLDETVPGGRYINAQGILVNAQGKPIDEDTGEVLPSSDTPAPEVKDEDEE
jgi:hypothetical protein